MTAVQGEADDCGIDDVVVADIMVRNGKGK